MKKILFGLVLAASTLTASAATFWFNGVLMGTVCRSGAYYTVYPRHMAQPVGTTCPVRDYTGSIISYGVVTQE